MSIRSATLGLALARCGGLSRIAEDQPATQTPPPSRNGPNSSRPSAASPCPSPVRRNDEHAGRRSEPARPIRFPGEFGEDTVYSVVVFEYPAGKGPSPDTDAFLKLVNAYAKGSESRLRKRGAATIDGRSGFEAIADDKQEQAQPSDRCRAGRRPHLHAGHRRAQEPRHRATTPRNSATPSACSPIARRSDRKRPPTRRRNSVAPLGGLRLAQILDEALHVARRRRREQAHGGHHQKPTGTANRAANRALRPTNWRSPAPPLPTPPRPRRAPSHRRDNSSAAATIARRFVRRRVGEEARRLVEGERDIARRQHVIEADGEPRDHAGERALAVARFHHMPSSSAGKTRLPQARRPRP